MLEARPVQGENSEVQSGVYPNDRVDDASQLLQLFLFPNNVNLNNLDSDNVQVHVNI